jgi:hypothetical protein
MNIIFLLIGNTICRKVLSMVILFLLILPGAGVAGRPLSTDDAGTTEKSHLEIESGFEYTKQTDDEYSWSACLKYGILEKWDIGIEVPYQFIEPAAGDNVNGICDIIFSTKYNILNAAEDFSALALAFSVKTKSGNKDKGLGTGKLDYSLTAILTEELDRVIAHLNLGYTYVGVSEDQGHDDVLAYALALEYPCNDRLNLVAELSGETNFQGDFNQSLFAALTGFNYAFSQNITFDWGTGWGISEASPDYLITSGLTLAF